MFWTVSHLPHSLFPSPCKSNRAEFALCFHTLCGSFTCSRAVMISTRNQAGTAGSDSPMPCAAHSSEHYCYLGSRGEGWLNASLIGMQWVFTLFWVEAFVCLLIFRCFCFLFIQDRTECISESSAWNEVGRGCQGSDQQETSCRWTENKELGQAEWWDAKGFVSWCLVVC